MVDATNIDQQITDYVKEHFFAEYLEGIKGKNLPRHSISNLFALSQSS